MSSPNLPIFEAILVRQAPWKGLSGATLAVAAAYIVTMLAAVMLSGAPVAKPKPQHEKLVVTLFDAARIRARSLENTGGSALGISGAPQTTGPVVGATAPLATADKQRNTTLNPTPKAKAQQKPKTLPEQHLKDTIGGAAQTDTPQPAPAPALQAVVAGSQTTAAAPGPLANAGAAPRGEGGSLVGERGSGSGTGTGSGAGSRAGVASGDTTVLPFMDGMTRPSVISKVDPEYTREARDANVQGLILTKCVITSTGSLRSCRIVKGIPLMDQAVLKALSQWKYSPVLYQGKPTAVEYVIPVRLVLR